MKGSDVKYPGMRIELLEEVCILSEPEIQKGWFDSNFKHSFSDSISFYILTLIDAMPCEDKPPDAIGVVFRNYEELVYVHFLHTTLLRAINTIDENQSDEDYFNSPLWQDVIEAAKQAHAVLMKDEDLEALAEAERNRVVE
ncbi:hypothetical protein Bealeia1_02047 (plasmid) [Candidatus Bealeia paramacronuclearis]|uniref:Uncharacterized protein n=1 Tax=Candidatus Bealeia paramacronuclearis TaxID=1921001 RepID=A0ABZ2CA55_9PROT